MEIQQNVFREEVTDKLFKNDEKTHSFIHNDSCCVYYIGIRLQHVRALETDPPVDGRQVAKREV